MKKYFILLSAMILVCFGGLSFAEEYTLFSPDKKIKLAVNIRDSICFKIYYSDTAVLSASAISMHLADGNILGRNSSVKNEKKRKVDRKIKPIIKEKFSEINESFNEIRLDFENQFSIEFRAYNEGAAYRFVTQVQEDIIINGEKLNLGFGKEDSLYFQRSNSFSSSYETPYEHMPIDSVGTKGLICLPALVETDDNIKLLLTESDLVDYPGMWLMGTGKARMTSVFPGYPVEKSYKGSPYGFGRVAKHADFIAKTKGSRTFPWRIFAAASDDKELITNQLVYMLASPSKLKETSWIKPGVVTFDWWARRNIFNADFKAGINTETAKYFIDFAAEFGLEYFLFDDGWTDNIDILKVNPQLNMEEIAAYAKEKNVQLMVWLIWSALERQMDDVFAMLDKWGVGGIKVDFMNRDDQEMVNFYHKVAAEAAKRKMVVNFHGAYKPAGLRRAYPNVLTREALIEFEYNGVSDRANPEHHNLLPFIRMVSGPMDYIPATMNNAQRNDFRKNADHPMGLGTRAHAMALFVVLESPMQMLPDSPSDYYKERECMEFIAKIPVEWDETIVLDAKIGDYIMLAKRSGDEWSAAAITDWDARDFDLAFDFLDEGDYQIEYIRDGLNADLRAADYKKETGIINKNSTFRIKLAQGGGWLARIFKH